VVFFKQRVLQKLERPFDRSARGGPVKHRALGIHIDERAKQHHGLFARRIQYARRVHMELQQSFALDNPVVHQPLSLRIHQVLEHLVNAEKARLRHLDLESSDDFFFDHWFRSSER